MGTGITYTVEEGEVAEIIDCPQEGSNKFKKWVRFESKGHEPLIKTWADWKTMVHIVLLQDSV